MRNTLIFFLISLLIIGCKDETTTTSTIHDPSKPVQITGFELRKEELAQDCISKEITLEVIQMI